MPCRSCHFDHGPLVRCEVARRQREAVASNDEPAINAERLTHARETTQEVVQPDPPRAVAKGATATRVSAGDVSAVARDEGKPVSAVTPNRRKREDYNAYMKRVMKERREKKRSGFLGIAYG